MTSLDPRLADDHAFDAAYPTPVRRVSSRFWTPVAVARRAAEHFAAAGARRVLDVGAGAGKFVLAAAAAQREIEFVGVEQRHRLVAVAEEVRRALALTNARFHIGDVGRIGWGRFDGAYLFNPLAENLYARSDRLDDDVELTEERFRRDVSNVEDAMRTMRLGAIVITYHGASTRIPASFELASSEEIGTDWLRVWVKRRDRDDGAFYIEEYGGSVERIDGDDVLVAMTGTRR